AGEILTRPGSVFGTAGYLSPEQLMAAEVDGRTDQYALGLIMYEMLAGQRAYDGRDTATLLKQQLKGAIPPLRTRHPAVELPPAPEQIVMRLLASAPSRRYPSPKELISDLDGDLSAVAPPADPAMAAPQSLPVKHRAAAEMATLLAMEPAKRPTD